MKSKQEQSQANEFRLTEIKMAFPQIESAHWKTIK
jgi:hypothetical protein